MAVVVTEGSNRDVWVWDLARRGGRTRLSTAPELDASPVWSPGGGEVAFASFGAGNSDIYFRRAARPWLRGLEQETPTGE